MSDLRGAPELDDGRFKNSNPVYWIERRLESMEDAERAWMARRAAIVDLLRESAQKEMTFPRERLESWRERGVLTGRQVQKYSQRPPSPGVVGLVYEKETKRGYAVPLSVEQRKEGAGEWSVSNELPFDGRRVSSILARIIDILMTEDPTGGDIGMPETLGFKVQGGMGTPIEGRSMDLAALMAVLAATRWHPGPHLRAVAAIARPVEGGTGLKPVAGIEQKLDAFHREYGRGSLLLRTSETEGWDEGFEQVWVVDDLADLAGKLLDADLLDAVFGSHELDEFELGGLNRRLYELVEREHNYQEALNLYNRLARCEFSNAIKLETREQPHHWAAEAARHLGKIDDGDLHKRNVDQAKEDLERAHGNRETVARLLARKAAQFYDRHEFEETIRILEELAAEFEEDDGRWNYQTQVEVFNTLARAEVALEREGWREKHQRMMNLQKDADAKNVSRSRNYLIHGCLREGTEASLEEAEALITEGLEDPHAIPMSNAFLDFYRADLARRRGQVREIGRAEERNYDGGLPGHPTALYLQATARQPGRDVEDALDRFRRAKSYLAGNGGTPPPDSAPLWLTHCIELGWSGWAEDRDAWESAGRSLGEFARNSSSPGVRNYYGEHLESLPPGPSREAAESFLETVPYF